MDLIFVHLPIGPGFEPFLHLKGSESHQQNPRFLVLQEIGQLGGHDLNCGFFPVAAWNLWKPSMNQKPNTSNTNKLEQTNFAVAEQVLKTG